MAALEPYCMVFGAKLATNSKMIALKIVKWIIAEKKKKKKILLNLWRMPSQLQVFLLPANFDSDRMTSQTLPGCQDSFKMLVSEVTSFATNFFKITDTSESEPKNVSFLEWLPLITVKDQSTVLEAYGVMYSKLNNSSKLLKRSGA